MATKHHNATHGMSKTNIYSVWVGASKMLYLYLKAVGG